VNQAIPSHHEVDIEDIVVRREGGITLQGRLFLPRGAGPFPAAVDVHGGAWVQGDRSGNDPINARIAQRGIAVLAVDHRLPPQGVHPAAVQDVNHAVRWLKANAARWNVRPEWVGLTGTSAGGHLALLAALKPLDESFAALPVDGEVDARVPFAVALWPVICPLRRYQEVVLSGAGGSPFPDRPAGTTRQMAYWQTEAAMEEGSPLASVQRGDDIARPPVLLVQTAQDPFHPIAHAHAFVDAYRARGGSVDLHLVEGEPYYLVRAQPESEQGSAAIERIAAFIHASVRDRAA
jgi:acetyl esterase/lipase